LLLTNWLTSYIEKKKSKTQFILLTTRTEKCENILNRYHNKFFSKNLIKNIQIYYVIKIQLSQISILIFKMSYNEIV